MESNEKRISFIQYMNTIILTVIGVFALMIYLTIAKVKDNQSISSTELVRIKTIQDINTAEIKNINVRVTTLENNNLDYIKTWTDLNYMRKPQK